MGRALAWVVMDTFDGVVVGGGIAGVSVGFELAQRGYRILLLEMERHLAQHTTGRSAALHAEAHGHPAVQPLTHASRSVFESPPDLTDVPLAGERRGILTIAGAAQMAHLAEEAEAARAAGHTTHLLDGTKAVQRVPVLRPDWVAGALWQPDAFDIDVAATHQMYVRGIRLHGGEIRTRSPVTALAGDGSGGWTVTSGSERWRAGVVVDAAGAWGDRVAQMAGVAAVGLIPKRRTAFMVGSQPDRAHWPLVWSAGGDFYFKPDGVQLLCSLAEEEPSEPGDPRPREEDIALAIQRINLATTLDIGSVRSSWTGLRTFAPDGGMVIGAEPGAPGFYWLVGQGGSGIGSAPAAAQLLASLIVDGVAPAHLAHVDLDALGPSRLRG